MLLFFIIVFIVIIFVVIMVFMLFSRETVFLEGISYYENGEYEKALENFKNYALARPTDVRVKIHLAELYHKQEEYIAALKECIAITHSRYSSLTEKSSAFAFMSEIYIAQDMLDKAAKVCIEGFRLDPKNKKIHFQLGIIYMNTDKLNFAVKEFNLVLAVDRLNIPARMNLANIHLDKRDETKAIFQFKKILEIEPNNKEARFKLAKYYFENKKFDQSIKELEQLSDYEGYEIDYHYMMSNYYIKQKDNEKVKSLLEKVVFTQDEKDERVIFMKYELALIYEEEEKLQEAYDLYKDIKQVMARYRDIDARIQRLDKTLFPEEYKKMIDGIDYGSLSNNDFEDLFYKLIDKMGFQAKKVVQRSRNNITVLANEKFKTDLRGKIMFQFVRSFEKIDLSIFNNFLSILESENAKQAILITTSTYTDEVIELSQTIEEVMILDKVNIFEFVGEIKPTE